ncbi:glutathione S-transferase LANCL1-like [Periophthalmus magnuspinnatus]|uniref:glutathione S-transferase LANCL1-like n=1 Tax=Periophthalmus magnuspinnatus TaxID=409849 RepID=UPI00145BCF8E|nr:glutathione S-transferase LANCL1-like [Periophthalmus magnuspinnatus]
MTTKTAIITAIIFIIIIIIIIVIFITVIFITENEDEDDDDEEEEIRGTRGLRSRPVSGWRVPEARARSLSRTQVFGGPGYLEDALQCGEVVWRYGLLKKGYGLCHGAAGNAYTFLSLYRHTGDPKHLYRACMFADWCMNYGRHGCRTPDTPFSLFEGMAGTIYFLADLLQPMRAKFPAFEV